MRKKIKYILLLSLIFVMMLYVKSYARITTNDPTVESGGTVSITINSQEGVASGAIKLTSNGGLTFKSASGGTVNGTLVAFSQTDNKTSNIATYTFTAPTVTQTTTYKIVFSSQDMADANGTPVADSTATATVTVKAKETQKPDTGNTGSGTTGGNTGTSSGGSNNGNSSSGTTTTPTVTEPKFTSVSKTVYATGNINLRSSWSTSSSATAVSKGTELQLTGTSTEKVNGYVWYRVTYDGKIKYVSKDLITETNPEEEKNNNANLKELSIENVELSPNFDANVTEYVVKLVDYENTKLNVTATAEDEKSTVKIEGQNNIKIGENTITITITAEDGTIKIYTVTVINEETTQLGLSNLIIRNVELKNFSSSIYEYEIEFADLDKLEIVATANEEGAIVEILGNDELVEGENIITIIVTSKDGTITVTYQIKATKTLTAMREDSKQLNGKAILISALIAVVALIIIIILVSKYTKKDNGIDYVYNDNLESKKDDIEVAKEIAPENVEELQNNDDYEEEKPRRPRKGKHSK